MMETTSKIGIFACLIGQCVCLGLISHYNKLAQERQQEEDKFLVDKYYQDGGYVKVYRDPNNPAITWTEREEL